MEANIKKLKKLALNALKSNKQIEKGEDVCRNISAVSIIYDHKKINFEKKVELLGRYIPGLQTKNVDKLDLMNAKNEWLKIQTQECQNFLKSIGITEPKDIKKFMADLSGVSKNPRTPSSTPISTPKMVKKITVKAVKTPSYKAPILKRDSVSSSRNSIINAGTLISKSPMDL
jgi:hypothetical protein